MRAIRISLCKIICRKQEHPINEPNRNASQRKTVLFYFSEGVFPWLENFILPFMYANANAGIPPQTTQVKSNISISSPIVLLHIMPQPLTGKLMLLQYQPELVDLFHSRGMKVNTWTVNDEESMEDMLRHGVDGIISNYPDLLCRVADRVLG